MLCEECGKNEATVHFQALSPDGSSETRNLCMDCMNKIKSHMGANTVDITGFLGALLSRLGAVKQEKESGDRFEGVCPACGTTYQEAKKTGLMGCSECYKTFREPLIEMLVKRNGSALYVGCAPGTGDVLNGVIYRLKKLRGEMMDAVEKEDFETAARLRDEIRKLEDSKEGAP